MNKLTNRPDIITCVMATIIAAYGLCSMGADNCGIGACIATEYKVQTEAAAQAKDKCAEKTSKLAKDTKAAANVKLPKLNVPAKDIKSNTRAPANLGDSSGDSC
jgi:hypothetical protein